jgi:hypothetical protein
MTQINNSQIACTFTKGSSTIAAGNSLVVNQAITFPSSFGSLPSNIKFDLAYYVVSATSATLQISAARGGIPIVAVDSARCIAQPGWFIIATGRNTITLDLDSRVLSAWTSSSSGIVTWTSSGAYSNTLRIMALSTNALGLCNTKMYTDFFSLGDSDWTTEYPSNFVYFGNAGAWSVLNPTIYTPLTPQWNSIVSAK